MALIKKSTNSECWREGTEEGIILHCWWECIMVQPLWRTVWTLLTKLNRDLPHDPAFPLLGMYLEKLQFEKMLASLCSMAKTWKQCQYPLTEEWICVCVYIYILLSHENEWKHATDTFATTCMDLEIIRLRGVSQRKTNITSYHLYDGGFPGGASSKEPTCWCRRHKRWGFDPWVGKIPWRRAWQPTAVFLPRESHGQRSLVGYGP